MSIFVLGGCGSAKQTDSAKQNTIERALVVKEGTLTIKSGDVYLLSTSDGIVNLTSTKVNLDDFLKKKIKVTGMYSGDVLYVDEVN